MFFSLEYRTVFWSICKLYSGLMSKWKMVYSCTAGLWSTAALEFGSMVVLEISLFEMITCNIISIIFQIQEQSLDLFLNNHTLGGFGLFKQDPSSI